MLAAGGIVLSPGFANVGTLPGVGSALRMPQQIASTGQLLLVSNGTGTAQLADQLRQLGHGVDVCCDIEQVLAVAHAHLHDLVLLDLPVPGLGGQDVLNTLQAHPALSHIPVIVLTATPDTRRLQRAFDAGAVDYIGKPCDDDELLARVQVHLRLKLTRDRLVQVARERQTLLNLVAHDLKNPLTSVLFACEMLALPDCKPARMPRYLKIIEDSTREALGYIHRHLEAEAAGAAAKPNAACAPLGKTLQWLAARYELQFEACGLSLRIQPPPSEICLAIDGQSLRRVGENLINNALKYARSGGELELVTRSSGDGRWQLLAQDRGPGVPASFQPRLFQPFQRLERCDADVHADAAQSTGLGLAAARQIIRDAGGQLWYEDREGGGACFLLELPQVTCSQHCG